MNVSGDVQGVGGSFKTGYQSSALRLCSTGHLNYYYVIRNLDSLPAAKCSQEIGEALYHIE